jgi:F-type H+-transporting ATPase subunit a
MTIIRIILFWLLIAWAPVSAISAEVPATTPKAEATEQTAESAKEEEKGLPPGAVEIGRVGSFPITNSMIVCWIAALLLIVFAQFATRRMKPVPEGAQNFWEWLVESLYTFLESIIGPHLMKKTFWFFATIFIFIVFSNWLGLVPGLGTIGWGSDTKYGFRVSHPWLRGANADLNMTFAMSMVFFACWIVWAFQSNGPIGFLKHLFAPKGESSGALKILLIIIFFAVGFLEVFSILFRPVSLSFRLYGNIFAGENMLEAMANLIKEPAWAKTLASMIVPVPFYFMELLVGVIQALVFMLLTAVFTMLICEHEEGHEAAHH